MRMRSRRVFVGFDIGICEENLLNSDESHASHIYINIRLDKSPWW